MNTLYKRLESDLVLGLRAWRRSRMQRGIAISLLGLLCVFGLIMLALPAIAAFPAFWWVLLGVVGIGWLALTFQYLILPLLHRPKLTQIARYLEEQNPDLEDRLATAVEFGRFERKFSSSSSAENISELQPDTNALLQRLLQDAINHTNRVDFTQQLQIRFARVWRALAPVAAMMALIAFFGYSGMVRDRLQQLYVTTQNLSKILRGLQVTPGDARIRRGETVEIIAQTPEAAVANASIYVTTSKEYAAATPSPRERGDERLWAMNEMEATTQPGKFLYRLFDIRDTLRYYVRAAEEFSPIYTIVPLDAPEIRDIRLTYRFPAEINLPPRQEAGTGDVYAPAGTQVDLDVIASQPLARAEWQLGENVAKPMRIVSDTLARISFPVDQDGYYVVRLANADGLTNSSVEYFIHLTPDEAPQITIIRPGRDARPTMLEEVSIAANVREDYGLKKFDLIYAINNQPPVHQDLLAMAKRDPNGQNAMMDFQGTTLLFLEDLTVQPGDFISYFFEAADAKQKSTSDLYFLEVRPFEEEFYRALSQGGGGESAPGLAVSQKEIITATWKLERQRQQLSAEELKKSSNALAETQASLQESVIRIAEAARMRSSFTADKTGKMAEYLQQATEAMREAVPLLQESRLVDALHPERRAYQFLLKADAEIRQRELSQNSGQASSFGQLQSSEELARLFQDELNKIQSKYETLQNQQRQQQEAQLNEAVQKVKELAQRQERLNELNRLMQRENLSKEEKKRQIERLRRQQEELNREVQNLARQMRQLGQSSTGSNQQALQQLEDNLRQTAEDMTRTTDNLRRDNLAHAGAEGNRALERLRRLEDQLQQRRSESVQENLAQLRQELQRMAESQAQLNEDMWRQERHQSGGAQSAGKEQRQRWSERQKDLQYRAEQARETLRQAQDAALRDRNEARGTPEKNFQEKQALSQNLHEIFRKFDQNRIPERMAQASESIEQEKLNEAQRTQQEVLEALKRAEAELGSSLAQLAEAPEEKLDLALQETQRLRRELEEGLQQSPEATPSGQQQQGGGRSGKENQNNQLSPTGSPSGGDASNQVLRPEEMNWWSERLWEGMRDLEKIGPFLRNDTSLAGNYRRLMQNYRGTVRTFRGGDPLRREQIEKQIFDPLRRFEAELATRLAVLQHQQHLLTARDEPVPPQYREMVEKYFELLSKKR
jgi:hypothetical protein